MKKILILTTNPKNSDKLRLDEEVREIQEGLQRFPYEKALPSRSRDQFEIIPKWAVRPDDFRRALLQPSISVTPLVTASPPAGNRSCIFISYKRGMEPDEPIAREVNEALGAEHDVFLPVGIV